MKKNALSAFISILFVFAVVLSAIGNATEEQEIIETSIDNQLPEKPTISGPASGKIETEYTYYGISNDNNGDQIFYLFDWDDGSTSFILGPHSSGIECSASNIWFEKKTYEIKMKAIDEHGPESDWSDPLIVNMLNSNEKILNDEIIDQSVPMGSCGFYNTYVAQSFRPTLNSLTKVEIPLFKLENSFGTVKLSIREELYGDDLTWNVVSVDEIPIQSKYDWVEFNFDDIEVKPGHKYYIVFILNDGNRPDNTDEYVFWIMSLNNPYSKGKPYQFYRYIWLPLWLLYPDFPDCSFKTYGYE
jgi:hypothetical protein